MQNMARQEQRIPEIQQREEEKRQEENTVSKKVKGHLNIIDEDSEDEIDPKELARLEKILKSQKK